MLPPTIANVRMLAGFSTADEALDHVKTIERPTLVEPKARMDEHGHFLALILPGDDDYDAAPPLEIVGPG